MKRPLSITLISVLMFGASLGVPMLIGIWLPDVITASRHTLAEERLASGHTFRVIQYWNRNDFYSTQLHVTSPDGRTELHTLDGDDNKSWHLPLMVDEQGRTATVILGGGRTKRVNW